MVVNMSNKAVLISEIQDKQYDFCEFMGRLCNVREETKFQSKIICGDVINELKTLHKDFKFDVIIIDPPYNIGKDFGNNMY